MKRNNGRIQKLFDDVRILPAKERGRGEQVFAAYSAAVASLGYTDEHIFGRKEIPGAPAKKGRS
jgi:hypothetical protein